MFYSKIEKNSRSNNIIVSYVFEGELNLLKSDIPKKTGTKKLRKKVGRMKRRKRLNTCSFITRVLAVMRFSIQSSGRF